MTANAAFQARVVTNLVFEGFSVVFSTPADPRVDEHRLRYAAFVEEHRWEPKEACQDGLERDEFDPLSCSTVITDASTGAAAACQRLILPEHLPAGRLTHAEREYRRLPTAPAIDFSFPTRHWWAEASRLTIAPAFRSGSHGTARRAFAAITFASLALAIALDRTVLFTLSDPRTARLTRRLGFEMHQVGDMVEFHGTRAVFRIDVAEVIGTVPAEARRDLARLIDCARLVIAPVTQRSHLSPHAA